MNWMSVFGLCLITIGTIFSFFGTYRSDKESQRELTGKIQEKNVVIENINSNNIKLISQNSTLLLSNSDMTNTSKELLVQNKDMLFKIENYQKTIEEKNEKIKELEELSKRSERGLVSITQYDGSYTVRQGGSTSVIAGTEENNVFKELANLEKEKKFVEMIVLCDKSISKTPKWYTPYISKAIALLNINNKDQEAIKLLEFVESKTPGDPQYIFSIANIYAQLGNKDKADEMVKTIPKEVMQDLKNRQNRRTVNR